MKDLSWPDGWMVKVGQRFQAIKVLPSGVNVNAGYSVVGDAYRFVRADVPPVAEWCGGKGK